MVTHIAAIVEQLSNDLFVMRRSGYMATVICVLTVRFSPLRLSRESSPTIIPTIT